MTQNEKFERLVNSRRKWLERKVLSNGFLDLVCTECNHKSFRIYDPSCYPAKFLCLNCKELWVIEPGPKDAPLIHWQQFRYFSFAEH